MPRKTSPAAKPAAKRTAKPVAKPAAKRTAKPVAKPAAKPAAKRSPVPAAPKSTARKTASTPRKKDIVPPATAAKKTAKRSALNEITVTNVKGTTARGSIRLDVSPASLAMYDLLCDGRWHDKEDVLTVGAAKVLEEDYPRAVEEGKRVRKGREATVSEYADSGSRQFARNNLMIAKRRGRIQIDAKERVRMTASAARQWRRDRSAQAAALPQAPSAVARQRFGDEQTFGGMLEFDAWAHAPLQARDVAYVRPNTDVDLAKMRSDHPTWEITVEPDGLISVAAPCGTPVKDVVTDWLAAEGIYHEGVRDARNVRRRNVSELPAEFLHGLVAHYTRYANRRVRERHSASMQRLVGGADDIAGEVALWVMECVAGFDPAHGVPFGAWLTKQIPNKVMDLNRASFGRTAADAEMKRARVIENYESRNGTAPTHDELRDMLGLSPSEMQRKERDLANLRGLRSTGTLETGPDAPELPVIDASADPEGDVMHMEVMQAVSRALLAASGDWDPETGRPTKLRHLGFLIVYLMHWQEWTKGDLTLVAGRAARVVTEEVNAVEAELAERLADLRDGHPMRPDNAADFVAF